MSEQRRPSGVTVKVIHWGGEGFRMTADAPEGKVFSLTETHCDISWEVKRSGFSKRLAELEADGFMDCPDTECDYCHPA